KNKFVVHEGVVFTNTSEAPIDMLVFRLFPNSFGEDVAKVHNVESHRGIAYQVFQGLLRVKLKQRLQMGDRIRLFIHYEAQIPEMPVTHGIPEQMNATHTGAFGHWGDSVNLGFWLPLLTHFDGEAFDQRPIPPNGEHAWHDPATFHVTLEVPEDLTVATTGIKLAESVEEGRKTAIYVAHGVREFAVHGAVGFENVETKVGETTVRVFFAPGDEQGAKEILKAGAAALGFYNESFGLYRHSELDIVRAKVNVALGTEYPGLVTISTAAPLGLETEWTTAHEVAHQWWYGEVGNDSRDAPWIDEALASYSAAMYLEHAHDEKLMQEGLRGGLKEAYGAMFAAKIDDRPANLPSEKYNLSEYGIIVYGRAAIFFDEMREELGREAFLASIKKYYSSNIGKSVTEEALLQAFRENAESPEKVDQLYQRWIVEANGFEDVLGKSAGKVRKFREELEK
ncbi:MAG: M1 family metallopeptidase, partial [Proteobacteria bacterium]|nr:M1 family metallopeptidase [Pseudomonadota bacterium]